MGVADWWQRWRAASRWRTAPADRAAELARLVGLAEAAYDRMYDARHPKDDYDDARRYFGRAIDEAQRLGIAAEVARLTQRRDHVAAVYDSQFRGR